MERFDIHNRKGNLIRAVANIKNSKLSEENKRLILKFHEECFSNGLSIDRVLFYLNRLYKIAQLMNKDFTKATEEDIRNLVRTVQFNSDYAEWTKCCFRITLKKFYQWLEGYEEGYPEKVRWIKTGFKKSREKLTNLPSEQEVRNLIENAIGVRDKAIISVLYESGCRVGELLNVRLRDLVFDDYGAVILVTGKTGPRRVRLVSSVPHLSLWIEHHPRKNDADAPLWINTGTTNHNKPMMYTNLRRLLMDLAKRINLLKPVNPHIFRKARATHLASRLTEAQMCEYFGWSQGSDMPSTYVHLSGRDIDDAILRMHGKIPKDNGSDNGFETKECPRCFHVNSPESQFCLRCRLPLNEKAAMELEERKRDFVRNMITPEIIEKMIDERVRQILKDQINA